MLMSLMFLSCPKAALPNYRERFETPRRCGLLAPPRIDPRSDFWVETAIKRIAYGRIFYGYVSRFFAESWIDQAFVVRAVATGDQNSATLRASDSTRELPFESLETTPPAARCATLPECARTIASVESKPSSAIRSKKARPIVALGPGPRYVRSKTGCATFAVSPTD